MPPFVPTPQQQDSANQSRVTLGSTMTGATNATANTTNTRSTSTTAGSSSTSSSFSSLLRSFGKSTFRSHEYSTVTSGGRGQPPVTGPKQPSLTGSSRRSAGVKPLRSVSAMASTSTQHVPNDDLASQYPLSQTHVAGRYAGPSRGGFAVMPGSPSARHTSPSGSSPSSSRERGAERLPHDLLPPSRILPQLAELSAKKVDARAFTQLITKLARSVEHYPFPPPPEAAERLSNVLEGKSGADVKGKMNAFMTVPTPTPLQIFISQSHLLAIETPVPVRLAVLDLLKVCIEASWAATGGIKEGEKAVYWQEAQRWAADASFKVDYADGTSVMSLTSEDREALVKVFSALTRGGRSLVDLPGLVTLLRSFVEGALPPRSSTTSPLTDPTLSTPFKRTRPPEEAPHYSAYALLIALHKFSSPHIYPSSTLAVIRTSLRLAESSEEGDVGTDDDEGVLGFLGAVITFTTVSGRQPKEGDVNRIRAENDGIVADEESEVVLQEVVRLIARLLGCDGLLLVEDHIEGSQGQPQVVMRPCILPRLAWELMRDLLRSPANQALKFLRSSLVGPLPDLATSPPVPTLLLVGTLRAFRNALSEISEEAEEAGAVGRIETTVTSARQTRWPTVLSLGISYLWAGLCEVMRWQSPLVDAEVLRLLDERIAASEHRAAAQGQADPPVAEERTSKGKEAEAHLVSGPSFEEWDMAVTVLETTRSHIRTWEDEMGKHWLFADSGALSSKIDVDAGGLSSDLSRVAGSDDDDDGGEWEPSKEAVLAFSALLSRLLRAWKLASFSGPSDEVFSLMMQLAPNLAEEHATAVLDLCDRQQLCLPSSDDWLQRAKDLLKAFYLLPAANIGQISTGVRRRSLRLLQTTYHHSRPLEAAREALVTKVILPLIESTFETETDPLLIEELLALASELAADEISAIEEGQLAVVGKLRGLFVRVIKRAVRPFDRYSASVPQTPKRGNALASLSRYHKDSSPSLMRSSPSISAPVETTSSLPVLASAESDVVPVMAVVALIGLFNASLLKSTRTCSEECIVIFRELLHLLSPPPSASAESLPHSSPVVDSGVPLRARLAILQWLVRLRADSAHAVYWQKDLDSVSIAEVLGRHEQTSLSELDGVLSGITKSPEDPSKARGRSSRQTAGRAERDTSASRHRRVDSDERSPSRSNSTRRSQPASKPLSLPLWSVPETLPFNFPSSLALHGPEGLVSFDHVRMRDWTEELASAGEAVGIQEAGEQEAMVVLPVSEYLQAVVRLLKAEHEWELVSYLLCFLPEQLSNKHFACGPRAAHQLHSIRRLLCDGLRQGEKAFLTELAVPPGVKRPEIHAAAYYLLTALIAYRSLFTKSQQDDIVEVLLIGLSNPRDTAKPSIHALYIASFELRPSVTKFLAECVRHLQRIISSATLGVHILELMATVAQEPTLYSNFTEIDFQTVLGIALKYIQTHNERAGDDPVRSDGEADTVAFAFSQYVLLMAYYNIAVWFMAIRLADRPKYVAFLTRRLVQANEGKATLDEATEVCFDMIARYAYSNADPRPRASMFDKVIAGNNRDLPVKSWIVGNSLLSIKSLASPAWVEVTIKRPSGAVRMLWEMQNINGVAPSPDGDAQALLIRHRETARLTTHLPSLVNEALASLPGHRPVPFVGHRARAVSFGGSSEQLDQTSTLVRNIGETVLVTAATKGPQMILESGPLAVDPAFYALQLSSFPDLGRSAGGARPLLVPNDAMSRRTLSLFDTIPVVDFHKIGVVYVGAGQRVEEDILANIHGSQPYIRFLSELGRLVRLKGCKNFDVYTGGLDAEMDFDGKWTYVWDDDISQIVFHVATMMPTTKEVDPRMIRKKAHIGNDYVKIIFNDSGGDFAFNTLTGDFNYVNIVIEPHIPAGSTWTAPGMQNNVEFFKVSMQRRHGLPEIGPLGTFKMVTASTLPHFVRFLCLHANLFVQIYLSTVGLDLPGGTRKLEFVSSWRRRLQEIKKLRERINKDRGEVAPEVEGQLDVQAEENARAFTSYFGV